MANTIPSTRRRVAKLRPRAWCRAVSLYGSPRDGHRVNLMKTFHKDRHEEEHGGSPEHDGPARVAVQHLAEADPDLVRSMLQTFVEQLMARGRIGGVQRRLRGAEPGAVECPQRVSRVAGGIPGRARSILRSRSCVKGVTSRGGCWSRAGGRNRRWSRWSRSVTSRACRRAVSMMSSRRWVSRGSPSRRFRELAKISRRDRGSVPEPAPRRWALHVCVGRRAHPEGPRRRPDRERRRVSSRPA